MSSWASLPSCHREPERCREQAGPATGGAASGVTAAAGMGERTAMAQMRRKGNRGSEGNATRYQGRLGAWLICATESGTGARAAKRRASLTSEAVPAPPGNATTSTLIPAAWSHLWATSCSCRRHRRFEQVAQAEQVVGDHVQAKHRTHLVMCAEKIRRLLRPFFITIFAWLSTWEWPGSLWMGLKNIWQLETHQSLATG